MDVINELSKILLNDPVKCDDLVKKGVVSDATVQKILMAGNISIVTLVNVSQAMGKKLVFQDIEEEKSP